MSHHPLLMMAMQRAQREIQQSKQQIRAAKSIRDVVTAMTLTLPPELRALRHSIPDVSTVRLAAEEKAIGLVGLQLQSLKVEAEEKGPEFANLTLGRLRQGDWMLLRGNLPRAAQHAEREAQRLMGLIQSTSRPRTSPRG